MGDRRVRGDRFACLHLCFSLEMEASRLRLPHLCTASYLLSVDSATMCISYSRQNGAFGPLQAADLGFQPTSYCYHISWGCCKYRIVSRSSVSVFPTILLALLTSTNPPSDVSMHGCLRHVCVLSMESLVGL